MYQIPFCTKSYKQEHVRMVLLRFDKTQFDARFGTISFK